jgi:hypothetical protein
MSLESAEERLLEVFSDPFALTRSFGPVHLPPTRNKEAPAEVDSRTFGFLKRLFDQLDPEKL